MSTDASAPTHLHAAPDLTHIAPRDKAEILAQALPYIQIGRASCRERV